MIAPQTQRYMAERMGATIRTHDVDHTPMHMAMPWSNGHVEGRVNKLKALKRQEYGRGIH